jgi:outer membrane protein assembly factor BamB
VLAGDAGDDAGGGDGVPPTTYAMVEGTGHARLRAYDLATGERRWRFPAALGTNGGYATPTVTDGRRVFFGADDGVVYALPADGGPAGRPQEPGTGAREVESPDALWTRDLDGDALPNRIAGAGETLLVGTYREGGPTALYALDARTGRERWRVAYDDELRGVTVAGGTVYATAVTDRDPGGDIVGTTLFAYE